MNRAKISFGILAVAAVVAMWGYYSRPIHYSSDAIRMRLVDKETKQPLEGVMVIASWDSYVGTHQHYTGSVHIAEAVTDKNGWFELAAWGPVENKEKGGLLDREPLIWFYKSGYHSIGLYNITPNRNGSLLPEHAPEHLVFYRQGETFSLEKTNSDEQEENQIGNLMFFLRHFYDNKNCDILKIPKTINLLANMRDERERKGKPPQYLLPKELPHLSHCFK